MAIEEPKPRRRRQKSLLIPPPDAPPKRPVGRPRAPGESLQAARRRKERALADKHEIGVGVLREKLLDADVVQREWEGILRRVRAGVLACTSRIRARLPHLTARDALVIDEELRAALTALGEDDGHAEPGAA